MNALMQIFSNVRMNSVIQALLTLVAFVLLYKTLETQYAYSDQLTTHRFSNKACLMACTPVVSAEEFLAFNIESLRKHVDYYTIIDQGSMDYTIPLVEALFPEEIRSGWLMILKVYHEIYSRYRLIIAHTI